ncbi:hypothetical protein BC937DRAFT_90146 [Endogone sp. FLAS-F59071]|nr:hypothetical protein BC937DRAFT_90146 [Endogone sp. FLAS-F59071]|eukprot:RUS17312.1 hypothetical protein BC937DRAFT_90146 [Endogone sp. FLAS-F59071]
MLLVKKLITYDPEDRVQVKDFPLSVLPEAGPDTSCLDILNFFQEGRSHMALITDNPGYEGEPLGVITLEDVIEELIGEEIIDETDVYIDGKLAKILVFHNKIKVIRRTPHKQPSIHPRLYPLLNARRTASSTMGSPLSPTLPIISRRTSTNSGKAAINQTPGQQALGTSPKSVDLPSPLAKSHGEAGIATNIMGYGALLGDQRARKNSIGDEGGNSERKPLL